MTRALLSRPLAPDDIERLELILKHPDVFPVRSDEYKQYLVECLMSGVAHRSNTLPDVSPWMPVAELLLHWLSYYDGPGLTLAALSVRSSRTRFDNIVRKSGITTNYLK